ncbi:MAG: CBS domain-containing protein [Bacteroidetes bacterium]|nr:MAG: CBS domain-containing protein [Bacteroidota bacterium]
MANSIQHRIAEFIKLYPPFDRMTETELERVALDANVEYYGPTERIFEEGSDTTSFFYIVRKGSVRIHHNDTEETLVDLCDEGDVFGVRPLLANEPYLASASSVEETLLYAIPVETGLQILKNNPEVGIYLARGYASGMPMSREQRRTGVQNLKSTSDVPDEIPASSSKRIVSCSPQTSIHEASQIMTTANVASIVVLNEEGHPIGIMTDSDLRRKVVSQALDIAAPVKHIMTQPVVTVAPSISHSEALIHMMNYGVHHLCITEDGKALSKAIGVIAERDLMLDQGLHPAVIVKFIRLASSSSELVNYRLKLDALLQKYAQRDTSVEHVARISASITDAVVNRLIQWFAQQHGEAPCHFSWIALGSMGRMEQILKTDQDHALIFSRELSDEETIYFDKMANEVTRGLEKWGLSIDIAGISATNRSHALSLKAWKIKFTDWLKNPEPENILNSSIFFDFRHVSGDPTLVEDLVHYLKEVVTPTSLFFPLMAADALNVAPPLSFFRQFVVEKNGEHKDEFDLKRRVLLPFCDIARLLCLHSSHYESSSTIDRYTALAMGDDANSTLFEEAARSYAWLLKLRWTKGTENGNDGRFVKPSHLSKRERQTMREIFSLLSDLEQVVRVRFRTDFISG